MYHGFKASTVFTKTARLKSTLICHHTYLPFWKYSLSEAHSQDMQLCNAMTPSLFSPKEKNGNFFDVLEKSVLSI